MLVEACVDSVESALAAAAGGAGRLELCAGLVEGGTTPSAGLIESVSARAGIPVFVLVRPRGGDAIYGPDDLKVMRRDIAVAAGCGAAGVVVGALTAEGTVDLEVMSALLDAAHPLPVTFHRAFDHCADPAAAFDALREMGVERVLTSGAAPTAVEGIPLLRRLAAAGSPAVVAAGRITEQNAAHVARETGVREIHVRCADTVESAARVRRSNIPFGRRYEPDDYSRVVTAANRIRCVVEATSSLVQEHA